MFRTHLHLHRMQLLLAGLLALLLNGCFGGGNQRLEPAVYDLFGSVSGSIGNADPAEPVTGLTLRLAEVQAPAWQNTPAMQYRLTYAEPAQRLVYAESRWAAPPAELLEQLVRRQDVVRRSRYEAGGCQLHLNLDEFIQIFDAPGSSRALIEVQVALLAPGNTRPIARQSFRMAPAAGGEAKSGVAGFVIAARDLGKELNIWLLRVQRETPDVAALCHSEAP